MPTQYVKPFVKTNKNDFIDAKAMRGLWEIPGPKTESMHRLLGGWQTSCIWTWQSGTPFSIFCGCNNAGTGIGNDLADQVAPIHYTSGSMATPSTTVVLDPLIHRECSRNIWKLPPNTVRGPRYFNVDLSLQKHMSFTERIKLDFRAEFFDVLNHPNFGAAE